jgi:AraC-like DNA-binding protein
MVDFLELDVRSLHNELKLSPIIKGLDALGPKERLFGSHNHQYVRAGPSLILQIQNFRFARPYNFRIVRHGFLAFQFTKLGSYYRYLGENGYYVGAATVQISNFTDALTHVSSQDKELVGVGILAEREYLIDKLGLSVDKLREPYRSIFTSKLGSSSSLQLPLPPAIWMVIDDILECTLQDPVRSIYLNAKAVELICLVIDHINTLKGHYSMAGLSAIQRQRQQLAAAAAIYRKEIDNPPTLAELAARVGLNRSQLVSGFHEQFGTTPHKYSMRIRLEWARDRIFDGGESLSEISVKSGYTSYAAFSRAYQAYFGHPPSVLGR